MPSGQDKHSVPFHKYLRATAAEGGKHSVRKIEKENDNTPACRSCKRSRLHWLHPTLSWSSRPDSSGILWLRTPADNGLRKVQAPNASKNGTATVTQRGLCSDLAGTSDSESLPPGLLCGHPRRRHSSRTRDSSGLSHLQTSRSQCTDIYFIYYTIYYILYYNIPPSP